MLETDVAELETNRGNCDWGPFHPPNWLKSFRLSHRRAIRYRGNPSAPGLGPVDFRTPAAGRFSEIPGVALDAEVACNGARFRENLLSHTAA